MKHISLLMLLLGSFSSLLGQPANPNTMTVQVDGKEFTTEPRRITIGAYQYITGNAVNPDKSLRVWLGNYDGKDFTEPGRYLLVGDENYRKDNEVGKAWATGQYKGFAIVRYVEETKSPRMEYHMGDSRFDGKAVDVVLADDGYLELTFDADLQGTWWKESSSATVLGGWGRITDKMTNKAVTSASGYDQDIDPEGNGYKKQKTTDIIRLSGCKVRLKWN